MSPAPGPHEVNRTLDQLMILSKFSWGTQFYPLVIHSPRIDSAFRFVKIDKSSLMKRSYAFVI